MSTIPNTTHNATGALPRSLYQRSPTLAVDDEEYRIFADGSVHYTGECIITGRIYDNTRLIRRPRYAEVDEGDDEDGNYEYEGVGDQDTRRDGGKDTKDGKEDDGEFETEDDISEKRPNQRNGSITLACHPIQHLLTRWNPPRQLLSTSDLLQWDAYNEDISRGAYSWRMGISSWILSLPN